MKTLDLLLLIFLLLTIASIYLLHTYNQYYSKKYIELERYIATIQTYLRDTYGNADRIELIGADEYNGSMKVTFAIIYNDSTFTPVRYHADFIYPDYKFAEIDPYIITHSDCRKECRLIYPEEVIYNLGLLKPELGSKRILSKRLYMINNIWYIDLETDTNNISAQLSISGDLLQYSEK
ncbi:MAG: hypothetical protein NZ908_02620 [Candidatus Micrarchaeota archaeon]|nr:hypothetical protein [Candidatus Micrarchaeota archaeon]